MSSSQDLQDLQARLAAYLQAEQSVLNSQETQVGGRRYRLADLQLIQNQIQALRLEITLTQASLGGVPVTHSTPVFRTRS
jgi:hypothetical protein